MGHPSFIELKSAMLDPSAKLCEVVADAPRLANMAAGLESDRQEILAAFNVLNAEGVVANQLADQLVDRLLAYRQRAADLLYQAYEVDLGGET